jgi:hypothetical protein
MDIGMIIGLLGILLFLMVGIWSLYLRVRLVKVFISYLLELRK